MNVRNILGTIWSLIEARPYQWVMLVLVFLEIGLISFGRAYFGWYWSPIIFTAISLAIGAIPLWIGAKGSDLSRDAHFTGSQLFRYILVGLVFIIGTMYTIQWSVVLWSEHPITVLESDVIPSVQLFAQRLMGGADGLPVYAPYDGFGYRLDPTYLPFQWLPFVVSETMGVDPRWMPLGIWLLGHSFYMLFLAKRKLSIGWTLALAIAPFWILTLIKRTQPQMLYLTIELMDVGYFMFLGWSLLRGNMWSKGIGFMLTLMSRFSHIFWAPFYFLGIFLVQDKLKAVKLGLLVAVSIVLIYIVPFLSNDWESFTRGQGHYTRAAVGAWSTSYDENPMPYDLRHGTGLAIHFYQGKDIPLEDQINVLRKTHIGLSILTALIVGLGYIFWYKKILQIDYYFLFGLKVYFAVFYGFIQVPYTYLYQVPVFLSLLVLAAAGQGRLLRK